MFFSLSSTPTISARSVTRLIARSGNPGSMPPRITACRNRLAFSPITICCSCGACQGSRSAPYLTGTPQWIWLQAVAKRLKWLAAMHRSSLTTGSPDSDWESLKLFRMATRLIKAVAVRPEKLDAVRELMNMLKKRIAKLPEPRRFVFTHGRYHHDHIFVSADAIAVIDLTAAAFPTLPRMPPNSCACYG